MGVGEATRESEKGRREPGAGRKAGRSMQGEVDRQAQPARELGALSNSVLCWPDKLGTASSWEGAWTRVGALGQL